MSKHLRHLIPVVMIISLTACSGPSTVSSNTNGTDEQSLSSVKKEIRKSPDNETLAVGTVIRASLDRTLSTGNDSAGDTFTMRVVDPVRINDRTVVPIGSTVKGMVAESVRSGRVKGLAHMTVKFTELVLPNGKSYPIQVASISRTAPSTKKKDAMIIGGGAGLGSIVGAIAGGGKGAAIGAAAGGGAGSGVVLATRGKETGFASGTTLNLRLSEPLKISLS
jgi:hypothetical protein